MCSRALKCGLYGPKEAMCHLKFLWRENFLTLGALFQTTIFTFYYVLATPTRIFWFVSWGYIRWAPSSSDFEFFLSKFLWFHKRQDLVLRGRDSSQLVWQSVMWGWQLWRWVPHRGERLREQGWTGLDSSLAYALLL